MIIVFFALIVFAFLFVGAVVFVVCALIPPTRRYALSAALWCAVWGPCCVGLMTLAGLGVVGSALMTRARGLESFHYPTLLAAFGWGYLVLGVLITTAVASGATWLHQLLMRRLLFVVFRLYATVVCAGIGGVFGWGLGTWMIWSGVARLGPRSLIIGTLALVLGFGIAAYKGAHSLQGTAPTG